jgi:hypothetical protein
MLMHCRLEFRQNPLKLLILAQGETDTKLTDSIFEAARRSHFERSAL